MAVLAQKQPANDPVLKVQISRKQAAFLASQAKFTLFCAGVGSGKTKAGSMWAADQAQAHLGVGFIGANTHKQLVRVTLKAFLQTLDERRIPYVFGRRPPEHWGRSEFEDHDMICSLRVGRIGRLAQVVCSQLTNYDILRGYEFAWAWLDETRDTAEEAFDVIMGRMRGGPPDAPRRMAITTTPNGFNWLYDRFVSNGEKALQDRLVIYATSHDNPWLPGGYAEALLANYSPRLALQEVQGKFVSLTLGQAFAEFSRDLHVGTEDDPELQYDPQADLIHTFDFNVNPLCSVILQVRRSGIVAAIDEIHVEGSARTRDATDEFVNRYRKHQGMVRIYGDPSGTSRDTRSTQNDFDIIEEAYKPVFGERLSMEMAYSAPGVFESVQDVNSLLLNAKNQVRLRFHPRCEFTIRDMEQVTFIPGTQKLNKGKKNANLTHHSDALRYYVSEKHPRQIITTSGYTPKGW
jgi:hypothetical protein